MSLKKCLDCSAREHTVWIRLSTLQSTGNVVFKLTVKIRKWCHSEWSSVLRAKVCRYKMRPARAPENGLLVKSYDKGNFVNPSRHSTTRVSLEITPTVPLILKTLLWIIFWLIHLFKLYQGYNWFIVFGNSCFIKKAVGIHIEVYNSPWFNFLVL